MLVRMHRLRQRAVRALDILLRGVARHCAFTHAQKARGGSTPVWRPGEASARQPPQRRRGRHAARTRWHAPPSTAYRSGSAPRGCVGASSSASLSDMAAPHARPAGSARAAAAPRAARSSAGRAARVAASSRAPPPPPHRVLIVRWRNASAAQHGQAECAGRRTVHTDTRARSRLSLPCRVAAAHPSLSSLRSSCSRQHPSAADGDAGLGGLG